MCRVLVIGADSRIGAEMLRACETMGSVVIGTSRRRAPGPGRVYLDLGSGHLRLDLTQAYDIAIMAAAIGGFEACETHPQAEQVNVVAPETIARQLIGDGRRVVFISTSSVFDGSRPYCAEEDVPSPVCAYSRQKAEAERRLRLIPGFDRLGAIVRLTKVLSPETPPLPAWFAALEKGSEIRPFSDLIFAPISVQFAALGIERIATSGSSGVFHLSGANDVTHEQFARALMAGLRAPEELVNPTTSHASGVRILYQPRHGALGMKRTQATLGIAPQEVAGVVRDLVFGRRAL
ncbi:MAG: sugar nucleotide-binding protein [Acidobacteriota bacterium]